MPARRSPHLTATGTLLLCAAVAGAKADKPARLLPADAIDVVRLLPAPPAKGSAEERAELDAVLAAQQARTPADVARAKGEEKFDVFAFADAVGPWFTADHCPRTAALFGSMAADAKAVCKAGKEHWARRRPPFVDDRIKPSALLEDEGSYPSSHAARGQLFAEMLAAVLPPAQREAVTARGQQIGFDRIVGGVHYPSDVAAGRVVGRAVADRLMADGGFRARLDAVKAELDEQAKATAPTP